MNIINWSYPFSLENFLVFSFKSSAQLRRMQHFYLLQKPDHGAQVNWSKPHTKPELVAHYFGLKPHALKEGNSAR